jgi:hypothetical protein
LVPLALIPANRFEMGIYIAGSWIAVAAAEGLLGNLAGWTVPGWPVTLGAVYLPMLYLVLRRRSRSAPESKKVAKDRRRPHRLPDHDLKVDVTTDGAGGVIVKVTHLPTQLSTTESGRTREAAERKAQDKLAAMFARTFRAVRKD